MPKTVSEYWSWAFPETGACSRATDDSVRAARTVGRPIDETFLLKMLEPGLSRVEGVAVEPDMREGVRVDGGSKRGVREMVGWGEWLGRGRPDPVAFSRRIAPLPEFLEGAATLWLLLVAPVAFPYALLTYCPSGFFLVSFDDATEGPDAWLADELGVADLVGNLVEGLRWGMDGAASFLDDRPWWDLY